MNEAGLVSDVTGESPIALRDRLPNLVDFVHELRSGVDRGELSAGGAFDERCRMFYTDSRMAQIAEVVPGWTAMASFADGKTLWHTTLALVAMLDLDEYRSADSYHRSLMEWIVLLHDVAKEPTPDKRDHRHAFRSAAAAAATLANIGFSVTDAWETGFPEWFRLTDSACRFDTGRGEEVQDNTRLPEIVGGIDRLFGRDAALIVKAILLHLSLTVLVEWPVPVPLGPEEERDYIDPGVLPLLRLIMLADSGGWNLFKPELAEMYRETRAVFARLGAR